MVTVIVVIQCQIIDVFKQRLVHFDNLSTYNRATSPDQQLTAQHYRQIAQISQGRILTKYICSDLFCLCYFCAIFAEICKYFEIFQYLISIWPHHTETGNFFAEESTESTMSPTRV